MSNDIEIRVTKKNQAGLDQLGKEARQAGKEIGDGLNKGFKEGEEAAQRGRKQIGAELDKAKKDAGKAGKDVGGEFGSELTDSMKQVVSGSGADVIGGLVDGLEGASGVVGAAGLAIAGAVTAAISGALEREELGGLLAAQLGRGAQDAARFGQMAGDVYADNFGDSLEDAADGIKAVVQNKLIAATAPDEAIRNMTEIALTASKVVGESANVISRAAHQMLVNGLADSAEDAFDMIVSASERGLNVNEDLIDTMVEYGTQFRELGLTGPQSLGLIAQAMNAGARDTDYAADALKEFAIRARDGSELTARGFAAIGLNAQAMGHQIAGGGRSASDALRDTLTGLRNIEDPVLRDQAAVDLFGTKAEDLGDALYAMDLRTAASQMDDFRGATEKAADSLDTRGAKIKGFFRDLKDASLDAGDHMVRGAQTAQDMADWIGRGFSPEVIAGSPVANSEWLEAYQQRVRDAAGAWEEQGGEIDKVVDSLDTFIGKQREAVTGVLDLSESQIGYQKALDDTEAAAKENGRTLDLNTEKGRNNREMLNELAEAAYGQIEAMEQQGASTEDLTRFVVDARERFVHWAHAMGLSAGQANALADELKLIPGDYLARVHADTDQASNAVRTIRGHLVDLTNRSWIASVAVTSGGAGGGRYFAGLAHGGPVGGGIAHAAEGGARGRLTLTDEMGPELKHLPDGTTVVPAGMSRAIMSNAVGGGGGGVRSLEVRVTGDLDNWLVQAILKAKRDGMLEFLVS